MKKRTWIQYSTSLFCFIFSFCLIFSLFLLNSDIAYTQQTADWTFFVYMAADNNLAEYAVSDVKEMLKVESSDMVNIVVLCDLDKNYDTYFVKIEKQHLDFVPLSNINPSWGNELDMSSPETLIASSQYVIDRYPALNYCLVLWDHGGGWKGESTNINKDLLQDKGQMMRMDELGEALWAVSDYKGGKIDIVAFDACLMGMVEVAYEIREYADIMVSSPELVDVRGFPYDTILSDLTANSKIDPAALSGIMVNKYAQDMYYGGNWKWALSAIDLNGLTDLSSDISRLASSINSNWPVIFSARERCEFYSYPWFSTQIDLYDFCARLNMPEAYQVINTLNQIVIEEAHGEGLPNAHGLAIYFPKYFGAYDSEYHNSQLHQISFPIDTTWVDFLGRYYQNMDIIHLISPRDMAFLSSPPTVEWTEGGCNVFALDVSLDSSFLHYYSTYNNMGIELYHPTLTVSRSSWLRLPTGRRIYWRVRGVNNNDPNPIIKKSDTFYFIKHLKNEID